MNERLVTMTMCVHCEQPVQPSLHTTVQCLDNMRSQRDEARRVAREIWEDADDIRDYPNRYPWLKEQSSVDEKGEGAVL